MADERKVRAVDAARCVQDFAWTDDLPTVEGAASETERFRSVVPGPTSGAGSGERPDDASGRAAAVTRREDGLREAA